MFHAEQFDFEFMKERPILFNGEMIRALRADRKTQTRRVVKHIPMLGAPLAWCAAAVAQEPGWVGIVGDYRRFCPYGQPGDRLWVRETYAVSVAYDHCKAGDLTSHVHNVAYRSGGGFGFENGTELGKWRPSIFMPRWASRITLEVVKVRVERVQSISEEDAIAEGVTVKPSAGIASNVSGGTPGPAQFEYYALWNSINSPRGFGWDVNPWVWVVEFKRVEAGK